MSDKNILKVITCGIAVALTGVIVQISSLETTASILMIEVGLRTSQLCGLILLVRHGSISKTVYWTYMRAFLAILIIGFLFRIQHYPYFSIILNLAYAGILVSYSLRYWSKKTKGTLDTLKMLWVLTFCTLGILTIYQVVPRDISFVSSLLFWITFGYFFFKKLKPKTTL